MMKSTFDKMEYCAANAQSKDDGSLKKMIGLLSDGDWRVRYAAAIALGDRREPKAMASLLEVLENEDKSPLFSQPKLEGSAHAGSNVPFSVIFPEGVTEETKEAWRRRGRLIQAVCLALGSIGEPAQEVLGRLHAYATDQKSDYSVRAAACKALGQLAQKESLPVLEKASGDEEWCTSFEAKKAVGKITSDGASKRERRGEDGRQMV